ncbi:DNA sulfur modification protein DndD [Streptomyces chilikensis]|uniref:DNA sulfur modification protein DndD n=1 Tax=Streptomyces chilikensis TaxID=1194079 RepID=UPI000A5B4C22|nr:DNA sulfur modification protein DndD [Streptomyces chilikensis]
MLLHKITLEEFGAYSGKQSLDLLTKKDRPIVLIGGLNGCGKTTLLDAIQLVLYGPRARCSGRGNRAYDTYLRESINRKADPSRGAAITVEFTVPVEGHEHYYKVVRSWRTSGKSVKEFLNVFVDDTYGERVKSSRRAVKPEFKISPALSENWADHIEDLLPLEVASLFFFDGEKIESLADPERAASVIESAVQSLLGVSTVEQLRADLLALQRRQRLSGEDQEVLEKIRNQEREFESADRDVEVANQELSGLRNQYSKAKKDLAAVETAFRQEGGVLFERRKELESERDRVSQQLADTRAALVNVAAGPLPLLMLGKQLDEVRAQAEREQDAAQANQVLGVLEQRDQWILELLGDEVPTQARDAVLKQLDADRKKRAETAELEVNFGLPQNALSQLSALDQALLSDTARAQELLRAAAEAAEHLHQLERQLEGVPAKSKVAALQTARSEHLDALAVARAAVERAEGRVAELRRRRANISDALERSHQERVKTLIRVEEVQRVITYSEKARETLERFGGALLKRHISRLEVAVKQSFNELMRKNGLVQGLRIDTDKFTLSLSDPEGEPIDPIRLSAGERQLLAVSLLWGLVKVAGNRLPSVIDTPLGRLDSRHREHLVERYFPNASHQVLLLSTDEEIDEHLLGRLKKSIAHTYTLVHDDTTFTTTVKAGYWWNAGEQHVA